MRFIQFFVAFIAGALMFGIGLSQTSQSTQSTSQSQSGTGTATATASSRGSAQASGGQQGGISARGSGSGSSMRIPKPTHVIFYTPTANWSQQSYDQIKQQRFQFFARLQEAGKLIYFGVWRDQPGEMSILVGTDEEMRKIASQDPAVTNGLLNTEVRPWTVQIEPYSAVTTRGIGGR